MVTKERYTRFVFDARHRLKNVRHRLLDSGTTAGLGQGTSSFRVSANNIGDEMREHTATNLISQFGCSRCDIECPWCGTVVTAYLWSLAGSGKKCPDTIHYTRRSHNRKEDS